MIVISGALVLVALVLLIIGVVGPDLAFVYASIAVSLVSLVFLVVGILQRRGDTAAEDAPEAQPVTVEDPAEGLTVRPSSRRTRSEADEDGAEQPDAVAAPADEAPVDATLDHEPVRGGDVLVVEGRPRYHVVGCRYLSGKTPEAVEVTQAREEGFTPCGVCKPDVALEALAAEEGVDDLDDLDDPPTAALAFEPEDDETVEVETAGQAPVVEEDVPGIEVPAPARRTGTRSTRKAPAAPAPEPVPARSSRASAGTATRTAARTATRSTTRSTGTGRASGRTGTPEPPAQPPVEAPAATTGARRPAAARSATRGAPAVSAAAAAASVRPARAAAPARPGTVVVIPDRGKYHRTDCRYVRDVDGAEELSRTAATRQGYAACGVCKP